MTTTSESRLDDGPSLAEARERVRQARAKLDEAMEQTPATEATTERVGAAASYLFALARRGYFEVVDLARAGYESAIDEIERVIREPAALRGMALGAAELASAIPDVPRQLQAYETLGLSVTELRSARDFPWCDEIIAKIDQALLAAAERTDDVELAMLLCSSADADVATRASALTGRALVRALERTAAQPVTNPTATTREVVRHVDDLRQWLNEVRSREPIDDGLAREAASLEALAARIRERAAAAIGEVLLLDLDALYDEPVHDVSQWARDRQELLAAGARWQTALVPGTVMIGPLVIDVEDALARANANGIGWALRSEAEAHAAHTRQHRAVGWFRVMLVLTALAWPVTVAVFRVDPQRILLFGLLALGACGVLTWELRTVRDPDAWLTFYRHPPEEPGRLATAADPTDAALGDLDSDAVEGDVDAAESADD